MRLLIGAAAKRPLGSGRLFAQLPTNLREEGLEVTNELFRRRRDVHRFFIALSESRHTLHANELDSFWAHKGKREFLWALAFMRITCTNKEGQMTVPVRPVLREVAQELPNQDAATPFNLLVTLQMV